MLAGVEALAEKVCTIVAEARSSKDTGDDCSAVKDMLGLCAWALALAEEVSVSRTGTGRLLARVSEALTEAILEASRPPSPRSPFFCHMACHFAFLPPCAKGIVHPQRKCIVSHIVGSQ